MIGSRKLDFSVEGLEPRILLSATPTDGSALDRVFNTGPEIPVWQVEMTEQVADSATATVEESIFSGGDELLFQQAAERQVVFLTPDAASAALENPDRDGATSMVQSCAGFFSYSVLLK